MKLFLALLLLALVLANTALHAAVWQWSVPAPTIPDRRAFLWIPPDCQHVRGVVVGLQNMIEKPLFERPAFRAACAENDLGIVMIFPGHDATLDDSKMPERPKRSYLDIFLNPYFGWGKSSDADENPQLAGEDLQKVFDALACESGYQEIRYAPLMPVGHSSAGPFVWHLHRWNPSRIFAMMPFKTGAREGGPLGIPVFDVNSEWFEYGNNPMHNVSLAAPDGGARVPRFRASNTNALYGYYVDIGSGHCDASDDAIQIMRLFLNKVVAARIPKNAPKDKPVQLRPVAMESGWLLDAATFGKPEGKPVKYTDWTGDVRNAFWYLDRELAELVQDHIRHQIAKQPQQIGFMQGSKVSSDARMFSFTPKILDDAGTFKLEADYVDHLDHAIFDDRRTDYYTEKLGHTDQPVLLRVNSGAVVQIGSNTFRICPHAGPIVPQGNPWEPTIVAYSLGDGKFRPAEHPAHLKVSIINKAGEPQTLKFIRIPDQRIGTKFIKLAARASSGLPVQYFMISGPATIDGETLTFEKIPLSAKLPIRIMVSAFQWGRPNDPKVQSIGPVTQEFFIQK